MTIQEFYKGILESLGLTFDEKGGCYLEIVPGQQEPFYVSNKHLVIPTQEVLRVPNWDTQIAFHPLSENIARKNSVVFNSLQQLANLSCNVDIGTLMETMVSICADKDKHKTMNHRQTAFLQLFPDADETSVKNFAKIEAKNGGENAYVKLITTRDGKLNDQQYPRVTKVKFPFYEEILKQSKEKVKEFHLFGVKVRKKDFWGFKALFEYIIQNAATPDEHYSFGSRSHTAPSFHSLMSAVNNVKKDTRKVFLLLKMDVPEIKWGDQLENLQQYKGHIPPLDGNEGELTEGEKRKQVTNIPVPTPVQPAVVQPQVQPVQQTLPPPVVPQPVPVVPQPVTPPPMIGTAQPQLITGQPVPQAAKPVTPVGGIKTIPFKSPFAPQQQVVQQPQVYQQPVQQVMQPQAMVQQPVQQMQMQQPTDAFGRPLYRQPYVQVQQPQPMMGYYPTQPMMGFGQPMVAPGWGQPQPALPAVAGWNNR